MQFNPVDPSEMSSGQTAKEFPKLADGTYQFVVASAEERIAKSGNEMIQLVLEHTDQDGRIHKVWDYLVGTESAAWKTYQFCKAANLMAEYEAGRLGENDCTGAIVRATVKLEVSEQYGDRLRVSGYEPSQAARTEAAVAGHAPSSAPAAEISDDDIPF